MTDSDLRALAEKATPGPWRVYHDRLSTEVQCPERTPVVSWMGFDDSDRPKRRHAANAHYIVAACNALPALLDRLDKAEAALRRIVRMGCAFDETGKLNLMCPVCAARAALTPTDKETQG